MDSRLSQQIATIRTAEALEQAALARAARDGRPRTTRKPPHAPARVPARIAALLAHR